MFLNFLPCNTRPSPLSHQNKSDFLNCLVIPAVNQCKKASIISQAVLDNFKLIFACWDPSAAGLVACRTSRNCIQASARLDDFYQQIFISAAVRKMKTMKWNIIKVLDLVWVSFSG